MARHTDIQHAMLIVSGSDAFHVLVKKLLPPGWLIQTTSCRSAAAARRCILERYFDLILIEMPLKDEQGIELAHFAADQTQASVLLTVPSEHYGDILARVTDKGMLVIAKPFQKTMLAYGIRFIAAQQKKLRMLEKKISVMENNMEELRLVSKAKVLLVEKRHMTEDEAHHYIGKMSMDSGISRKRCAEEIIDDLL